MAAGSSPAPEQPAAWEGKVPELPEPHLPHEREGMTVGWLWRELQWAVVRLSPLPRTRKSPESACRGHRR